MHPLIRIVSLVAIAALTLIAALMLTAAVQSRAADDQLTVIRRAVTLEIQIQTDRTPTALTLKCGDTTTAVIRCAATWRNKRYSYDGRVTVTDDGEEALAVAFKGTRVDRACAARKKGSAKRRCRRAYSF